MTLTFRKALPEDMLDIFSWRNDIETRKNSFNSSEVSLEEHKSWFEKVLSSHSNHLFILLDNSEKIGVIRFDRLKNNIAEISINLSPEKRGKGYGTLGIKLLSNYYLKEFNLDYILSKIKKENASSINSFKQAGYILNKEESECSEFIFKN